MNVNTSILKRLACSLDLTPTNRHPRASSSRPRRRCDPTEELDDDTYLYLSKLEEEHHHLVTRDGAYPLYPIERMRAINLAPDAYRELLHLECLPGLAIREPAVGWGT